MNTVDQLQVVICLVDTFMLLKCTEKMVLHSMQMYLMLECNMFT